MSTNPVIDLFGQMGANIGNGLAGGVDAYQAAILRKQQMAERDQQMQYQRMQMGSMLNNQADQSGLAALANGNPQQAAGLLADKNHARQLMGLPALAPVVGGLAPKAGYSDVQAQGPFDPAMGVAKPMAHIPDWSQGSVPDFKNPQTNGALLSDFGYMPAAPSFQKFGNGRGGTQDVAVTRGIDGTLHKQVIGSTPAQDMYTPHGVFNPNTRQMDYTFAPAPLSPQDKAYQDAQTAHLVAETDYLRKKGVAADSTTPDPVETSRIMSTIEQVVGKRYPMSQKEKIMGVPDPAIEAQRDAARESMQKRLLPGLFGNPASATSPTGPATLEPLIGQAAQKYGLDPALLRAIGTKESGLNPNAPRGTSGEVGPFQVMPDMHGVSADALKDPATNVDTAARLLSGLIKQYGNVRDAVKHYNGSGPAADAYAADVTSRYKGNGLTPAPARTPPAGSKQPATAKDLSHALGIQWGGK